MKKKKIENRYANEQETKHNNIPIKICIYIIKYLLQSMPLRQYMNFVNI